MSSDSPVSDLAFVGFLSLVYSHPPHTTLRIVGSLSMFHMT